MKPDRERRRPDDQDAGKVIRLMMSIKTAIEDGLTYLDFDKNPDEMAGAQTDDN